jgi:hypothetical protein
MRLPVPLLLLLLLLPLLFGPPCFCVALLGFKRAARCSLLPLVMLLCCCLLLNNLLAARGGREDATHCSRPLVAEDNSCSCISAPQVYVWTTTLSSEGDHQQHCAMNSMQEKAEPVHYESQLHADSITPPRNPMQRASARSFCSTTLV